MTIATTRRVLHQLKHDPRTLVLLFVVPSALISLLAWVLNYNPALFDHIGAPMLAIFPFVMMFIITSVTTLRERSGGTLERILSMPIAKLDILLGYALAFGAVAVVQATIVSFLALHALGLNVAGPEWLLVLIALVDALLGTALGLFLSAFARTEFQAVQFMPAFVLPQVLLCGLLVPVAQLPTILRHIAQYLPLTYAVDAMQHVTTQTTFSHDIRWDVGAVLCFVVLAILLGALTLRRKIK